MGDASYGPVESARDLARIRDGTASFEDRARLEHFLLRHLQEGGNDSVASLLIDLDELGFSPAEVPDSADRLYTSSPADGVSLLVATHLSAELASVNVTVQAERAPALQVDPRHQEFYAIWESLLGATPSQVAELDSARRTVYLIALLEAEVMNGGFGQYLTNTDGEHIEETLAGLRRIGAERTVALLIEAAKLGSAADSYAAAWDDRAEEFGRLDAAFLESGEDLSGLTADAILRTG